MSMSMSMSSSNSTDRTTHVLVFPYPAQGHMLALLDLTHQLAIRNLQITILTTHKNLPTLSSLLHAHPSIQTLLLPFPSHPSIPTGVENVQGLGNKGNLPVMAALTKLFKPITQWFQSHSNPPVAIISDFFLGWTFNLARQLNIVRIAFFSTSLLLGSVLDYCWNHIDDVNSWKVAKLESLPRSPYFKQEHLPSVLRNYKESDPDWEIIKEGMIANTRSWACVFNSFEALEGEYFDYLKRKMGHGRGFCVGPLSLIGPESTREKGDPGLSQNNYVLKWLDGCPNESVLYVCFGSQKVLKREQTEALALGLEKSGIRFLWVVSADGYGLIPDGFEDRVSDRGLVYKGWAPQVSILSHQAVCGFLSHCGWNSVLEGMAEGVLILCWAMEADQFVNAKLLVEDWGVSVKVCEGGDTVPDSGELGRIISESLATEFGEVKRRAKQLRAKALEAVKQKTDESGSGSSIRDLDRLVQELRNL